LHTHEPVLIYFFFVSSPPQTKYNFLDGTYSLVMLQQA
jgi:hypothetical protein